MRELTVPAEFTVGGHDNIVATVFEHERNDPDTVIFQRAGQQRVVRGRLVQDR